MENTTCHLIGGAPRTGKTTLANEIATKHGIKPLSTDSILVMMMKMVQEEDYPDLFYLKGMTVEDFYEKYSTPQQAVEAGVKSGVDAERGLIALLEYTLPAWKIVVLEGDVVTPSFAKRMQQKFPTTTFYTTFLYDDNEQRIRERIFREGLWSRTVPYSDDVKPKEVAYAIEYNKWFLNDAKLCGIGVTNVNSTP